MHEDVNAVEDVIDVVAVDEDVVDEDVVDEVDVIADVNDVEDVLVLAEVDESLTLPVWEATGEPRVDAALELLTMLDVDDVSGHAEVFAEVHDQLRATLADLDAR